MLCMRLTSPTSIWSPKPVPAEKRASTALFLSLSEVPSLIRATVKWGLNPRLSLGKPEAARDFSTDRCSAIRGAGSPSIPTQSTLGTSRSGEYPRAAQGQGEGAVLLRYLGDRLRDGLNFIRGQVSQELKG